MHQSFRIVCRGSKLSLAQADIFKQKLYDHDPQLKVTVVVKETRGDANPEIPLQEMEGKDFFTQDIQDYLLSGQADFAVHSLKDVSGENFFQGNNYAIIERDDPRDVAIFNEGTEEKLNSGKEIILGTSSPRRTEMGLGFLQKALPRTGDRKIWIGTAPIRGNVDTRLQKLAAREYDGIILACAGLNRLLRADLQARGVATLLKGKLLMILPLLQCPPAPGQGAIVAETTPGNAEAVRILRSINNVALARAVDHERIMAHRFGSGCHQKFGVIHVETDDQNFTFAAGKDRNDRYFSETHALDGAKVKIKIPALVDASDPFFIKYGVTLVRPSDQEDVVGQKVWVAETHTWFDLALKGIWVQGSLEGFGLGFIKDTIASPLSSPDPTELSGQ